jgi:ATP-dependent Clp protease ATP-binding subunit ClpX
MTKRNRDATCSFCRKSYRDVGPLVEGPGGVYICGDCVELCQSIIEQETHRRAVLHGEIPAVPMFSDLVEKLNPFFPGQEKAVRAVCVAFHDHYLARDRQQGVSGAGADALLLLGPSRGSKLFLARFLAHLFGVPFAHGEARTALEPDAFGPEGGSVLYQLLGDGRFVVEGVQRGVVYLDGVGNPGVQSRLLDVLQGKATDLLPRGIGMNLMSVLFVCGEQYPELINARQGQENPILWADLVAQGMLSELALRFRAVVPIGALADAVVARIVSVAHFERMSRNRSGG